MKYNSDINEAVFIQEDNLRESFENIERKYLVSILKINSELYTILTEKGENNIFSLAEYFQKNENHVLKMSDINTVSNLKSFISKFNTLLSKQNINEFNGEFNSKFEGTNNQFENFIDFMSKAKDLIEKEKDNMNGIIDATVTESSSAVNIAVAETFNEKPKEKKSEPGIDLDMYTKEQLDTEPVISKVSIIIDNLKKNGNMTNDMVRSLNKLEFTTFSQSNHLEAVINELSYKYNNLSEEEFNLSNYGIKYSEVESIISLFNTLNEKVKIEDDFYFDMDEEIRKQTNSFIKMGSVDGEDFTKTFGLIKSELTSLQDNFDGFQKMKVEVEKSLVEMATYLLVSIALIDRVNTFSRINGNTPINYKENLNEIINGINSIPGINISKDTFENVKQHVANSLNNISIADAGYAEDGKKSIEEIDSILAKSRQNNDELLKMLGGGDSKIGKFLS